MSINGFYEEKLAKIKAIAEAGVRDQNCTTQQRDGSFIPTPVDALNDILEELSR